MHTAKTAHSDDEFREAARLLGEHMGERTAAGLKYLMNRVPGLRKDMFPAEFLLGLGLAGQLRRWECLAESAIEGEGLPRAEAIFHSTVRMWSGPELLALVISLLQRVRRVFYERFLWCAERDCEVIAIQSEAEDLDLEALADFLIARALNG